MQHSQTTLLWFSAACLACWSAPFSYAQGTEYSSMLYGPLGLNAVPNARMDEVGTVRLGISTLDPYLNGYLGFQLAEPLYVQMRQTAEVSNINEDPDRLYPGVDLKLRLLKEAKYRPEISVGLQSAIGHRRSAGEYIAASKRWRDFDFTAGLGWGRYGTAAHFNNPLKALSNHFGKDRDIDGEQPNQIEDWFTGDQIGLFGGIEYFTPLKGLSIKADYGADRYSAERAAFDYQAPAPWSIGANYKPASWVDLSVAAQGTDKIMGRISLQGPLPKWPKVKAEPTRKPMRPYRTGIVVPARMELDAQQDDVFLKTTQTGLYEANTQLILDPGLSLPAQLRNASINIANHAGPAIEKLTITPVTLGLKGPSVSVMRKDLERAITRKEGSAQEIWRSTSFKEADHKAFKKNNRSLETLAELSNFHLTLKNEASLAEEDSGFLFRTAVLAGIQVPSFFGFLDHGVTMRLNTADNLSRIQTLRPLSLNPVRSDVQFYAEQDLAVEELYTTFTHSFTPDLHLALTGGYLEEMYAGFGGEILYRPFKSRFAIGAEGWQTYRRSPFTSLNLGFFETKVKTGHLNLWYDVPKHDITFHAKAGRYLAEDTGLTLGLNKQFENGAKLEGFVTLSDTADFDLFGGTTHSDHGLRLTLPLVGLPYVGQYIPNTVKMENEFRPFGRDIGQTLNHPLPLYEVTEPFSAPHIIRHWGDITEE